MTKQQQKYKKKSVVILFDLKSYLDCFNPLVVPGTVEHDLYGFLGADHY